MFNLLGEGRIRNHGVGPWVLGIKTTRPDGSGGESIRTRALRRSRWWLGFGKTRRGHRAKSANAAKRHRRLRATGGGGTPLAVSAGSHARPFPEPASRSFIFLGGSSSSSSSFRTFGCVSPSSVRRRAPPERQSVRPSLAHVLVVVKGKKNSPESRPSRSVSRRTSGCGLFLDGPTAFPTARLVTVSARICVFQKRPRTHPAGGSFPVDHPVDNSRRRRLECVAGPARSCDVVNRSRSCVLIMLDIQTDDWIREPAEDVRYTSNCGGATVRSWRSKCDPGE